MKVVVGGGGGAKRESEGRRSWEACLSFISERRKAYCEGVERGRKGRDVGSKESGEAQILLTTHRETQATQRERHTCPGSGKPPNILQPRSILLLTLLAFLSPLISSFPPFFFFFLTFIVYRSPHPNRGYVHTLVRLLH